VLTQKIKRYESINNDRITAAALLTISCRKNRSHKEGSELGAIFPKGQPGPAEHFTGSAWNSGLVTDEEYNSTK
jgi:hypothetical protein